MRTQLRIFQFLLAGICIVYLCAESTDAQSLVLDKLETSAFPQLRARLLLSDSQHKPYPLVKRSDFELREQTHVLDETELMQFDSTVYDPSATLFLIDISQSMVDTVVSRDGSMKESCISIVRHSLDSIAVDALVHKQVLYALHTFSSSVYSNCTWTDQLAKVADTFNDLHPFGGSEINTAFFDKTVGAVATLQQLPAAWKRTVNLVSDGQFGNFPLIDSLIFLCLKHDIVCNVFIFSSQTKPLISDLRDLALRTGGRFSLIREESELINALRPTLFSSRIETRYEYSWKAPYSCDQADLQRRVDIRFLRDTTLKHTTQYLAPAHALRLLDVDTSRVQCQTTSVGNSSTSSFSQFFRNSSSAAISLRSIRVVSGDTAVFNVETPLVGTIVPAFSTADVRIRFRPQVEGVHTALLAIESDCKTDTILVEALADKTSGVDDLALHSLCISPQPASTHFVLRYSAQAPYSQANLLISDMLGNVLLKQACELNEGRLELRVDASRFGSGYVFLQLELPDHTIVRTRALLQSF